MELVFNTADKLSKQTHLLESSYIKFGAYLPGDGSQDGDKETLHAQGGYHNRYEDILESDADVEQNANDEE